MVVTCHNDHGHYNVLPFQCASFVAAVVVVGGAVDVGVVVVAAADVVVVVAVVVACCNSNYDFGDSCLKNADPALKNKQ